MKRHVVMFVGCAALLALPAAAFSAAGPYLSLNGGVATVDTLKVEDRLGTADIESDIGLALTGAAGYGFGRIRLEAEAAYQKNEIDSVKVRTAQWSGTVPGASGDVRSLAGLFNGYYGFTNNTALTPFLSAGAGFANVKFSVDDDRSDGTSFAYQAGGGFGLALNPALALDVKYRYFATVGLEIDDMDVDYSSHNIYGGMRFAF